MEEAALYYIKQKYPSLIISEMKYLQSAAGIVTADYAQQNVTAMFIHSLYISSSNTALPITFKDQFNMILFTVIDTPQAPYFPITQVKEGSLLKITCSNTGILFSVSYQYLMQDMSQVKIKAQGK